MRPIAAIKSGLQRIGARIYNLGAASPVDPRLLRYLPVPARHAGVLVDHDTAMTFSAWFRGVSFISQSVAMLPATVIRENDQQTVKMKNHSVWQLLQVRANPEMSSYAWLETMVAWAISWGNGYSEIEFSDTGQPIALWPIEPYRVRVSRSGDYADGPLVYKVTNNTSGGASIPADRMFHLHGLGFNGITGYSVVSLAARSLGLAIGTEQFSEDFFANGAISHGAIEASKQLSPDAKANIRKSLSDQIQGAGRRFNIPIFEAGYKWVDMMVNPDDAQLLATRQFSVTDIARWLGLPPHKLQDLSEGQKSNVESQNIEVVNDALMPWIIRLEQEIDWKLLRARRGNLRSKIEVRGLLRGDHATRAAYYKSMQGSGNMSINEVRRLEDMDPIGPMGDYHLMQKQYVTLEEIVGGSPGAQKTKTPQLPTPPLKNETIGKDLGYFKDAMSRILKREAGRFDQVRHKCEGDLAFFDVWLEGFLVKHREYAENCLRPLCSNFLAGTGRSATGVIPGFLELLMEDSSTEIRMALQGQRGQGAESRNAKWAKLLIERLALSEACSGAPLAKPRALPAPKANVQVVVDGRWTEIGVEPNGD